MAFEGNTWWTYLIFAFIAITALLGNALVLYVLVTRRTYLKHPYNIFIFSLALTDILTAIFLVFSRYLYLPPAFGSGLSRQIYCKFIWSAWTLFTLGYISIYTCAALTIERWLAVTKPIIYRSMKRSQVIKALICVWLWAIATNVTTLFRIKFNETKNLCTWMPLPVGNEVLPWFNVFLQSIIPFTIMVVLYCHILYTMSYKLRTVSTTTASNPIRKVTKVALAASLAIIIGWLPSRVSFMLSKYGVVDPGSLLHYCLVILSFANSCINPFLYGIYSSQFRKEYKEIFKNLFNRPRSPLTTQSGSLAASQDQTQTDVTSVTTRM